MALENIFNLSEKKDHIFDILQHNASILTAESYDISSKQDESTITLAKLFESNEREGI